MMWQSCILLFFGILISVDGHEKRSIDSIAVRGVISQEQLSGDTMPTMYHLFLQPFPADGYFEGAVKINVMVKRESNKIVLHAHPNLTISSFNITQLVPPEEEMERMKKSGAKIDLNPAPEVDVEYSKSVKDKHFFVIGLTSPVKPGAVLELHLLFTGKIYNETSEGLFRSSYEDPITKDNKWLVATHMRPNMTRSVFPCYDEPAYKAPMVVSVARRLNMKAVSNMPIESTKPHESMKDWVWDTFRKSPPMSTFSLGIVVSELNYKGSKISSAKNINLRVWTRLDSTSAFENISRTVETTLRLLEGFWGCPFPLPKLDIFSLPNYQSTRPADGWGVIIFKEEELSEGGPWHIVNELVYQWLGALTSPLWWSHAYINNDLASYVTFHTMMKMNADPSKKLYMTMLYSLYYELSSRSPRVDDTVINQYMESQKNVFIFRMLNYILEEKTFVHGMRRFMSERQFETFVDDDVWTSLDEQARFDEKLPQSGTVNEIAASWVTQGRLPLVTVTRNYNDNTANLKQGVFIRERPQDIPDKEKFLWWIPIVLVRQDKLYFDDTTPHSWMKKEREVRIKGLPEKDSFIIVNPEEIGPFPVNYDSHNWALLAKYLCSENRNKILVVTRAKLLHDAWNLAYAGELNFATALNMTLFLKFEREKFVWERAFTMIDHIGRLIDGSRVYKKFQTYVRILLSNLYEELGEECKECKDAGTADLRRTSKVWLRDAGDKPFVEEAQKSYKKWIETPKSDEETPLENLGFFCPVFKFGTVKEWELGLERLIQFPATKETNERYYLLKTLAGCPDDAGRIEKLLNITILEQNRNFTDKDIKLIFSMLTGGADGYKSLFNFLRKNWDIIKVRFENKPELWNSLIESATTLFKTKEGLDMVSKLYKEKQGKFGTANDIIEKGLKRIKEETKWSNKNYPVMEEWLDQYIKTNDV